MNKIKQEEKLINEVKARVERWGNTPDYIKELYYKGMRKREVGIELILKAKFELQQTENWKVKLKGTNRKPIDN